MFALEVELNEILKIKNWIRRIENEYHRFLQCKIVELYRSIGKQS